jgi:hypothetical protein
MEDCGWRMVFMVLLDSSFSKRMAVSFYPGSERQAALPRGGWQGDVF